MGETVNIAEIASEISKGIFRKFGWFMHPKRDDNFPCVNEGHVSRGGKSKLTHPGDVVFSYSDPYLGKTVCWHTDLKSYSADSITLVQVRAALKSLSQTVECARESGEWRNKYGVDPLEPHEVRGLLFVHNHDGAHLASFDNILDKVDLSTLNVAPGVVIGFLGPNDIQRLWSIVNDIKQLIADEVIAKNYTFLYPDLTLSRRHGDDWDQPATFEALAGPFLILKAHIIDPSSVGYVVYYNRKGETIEEFQYFLDCLSRFQMLDSNESLNVRVVHRDAVSDLKANFDAAVTRYVRAWGFDPAREDILRRIRIDRVPFLTSNYDPGDIGWRSR